MLLKVQYFYVKLSQNFELEIDTQNLIVHFLLLFWSSGTVSDVKKILKINKIHNKGMFVIYTS